MIRIFLFLLLPSLSFAQDTIFNKKLSEVKVLATQKKESNAAVINIVRNNSVVSDGISMEYIKRTPDKNVGDVLKRVNGVTIQNDKFVLVRGLADRYNLAMLNKNQLPSTEPDRRSFSFDIIPSSLIDNVIVSKSATPSLPGDFAGGIVQISTKEISKNFFSLGFGVGYGSLSSFRKMSLVDYVNFPTQFPSTYTFRTGSNGDRRAFTKVMSSPTKESFVSLPNLNGNLSFGYRLNKWNVLVSATSRKTYSTSYIDRKDYQSSTELAYKYRDTSFSEVLSANGLLNLTYLGKNKYSWKTLFNHQVERSFMVREGENYDNIQEVRTSASNAIVKNVLNSQFDGKIKDLDFNVGFNLMLRDQPDYRINPVQRSLGTNNDYSVAWRDTYRFWSVMNEKGFNGSVNKSFGDVKIGGSYLKKYRSFKARIFRYESEDLLNEITNNTDRYKADFDLGSGYVSYDKNIGKLRVNGGLRTEYNLFKVSTADFSGQKVNVNRTYLDYLPSLNLSYNQDNTKYRFSVSKTLSRPEFREVANFAYYDFVRNAQILGNPNLKKTDIYNLDLKWEYYSKSGENVSVGLFGKNFIKPIEQIVADGSVPSNLLLTFMNPNRANVYGLEIEVRKKLASWIDVYANTAIIKSEVNVNGNKRQLQGQSNYVVNGGLNLHKNNNTINLTYNRVGDRISAVGFQGYPDIFENSRNIFDLVYLRKVKMGEIKLAIADIFAEPSRYYQKINNRDLIRIRNERSVSLTLNVNL